MQNVKSFVYPLILVGACVVALITLGFWPLDASMSQTKALRKQISQSTENIAKAIKIISSPKLGERAIGSLQSPLDILKKSQAEMTSALRENSEANPATLTLGNQQLSRINTCEGYFYQRQIAENSAKMNAFVGKLEKDMLKYNNLQATIRHLTELHGISDQDIIAALEADIREIASRKQKIAEFQQQFVQQNKQRKELENKASAHLERSSEIRDEIVAEVSKKAQQQLEVAISEKRKASIAIDEANGIMFKIDNLKGQIELNKVMLAEAEKRAESGKGELEKRNILKAKLQSRLAAVQQEQAVTFENIDGIATAIARICIEIDKARETALGAFAQAKRAAKVSQRKAEKNQIAETFALEGDTCNSSVVMLFESAASVAKIANLEPKLSNILAGDHRQYLDTMKSFAGTLQSLQQNTVKNLENAIQTYRKASSRTDAENRWAYQIREYQVRLERFRLTGQEEDKSAAERLLKNLENQKERNPEVLKFIMSVSE